MFKVKKDRNVVELAIEFNLTAINKWLGDFGEIKDIEKIEKDWAVDAVKMSYWIDVLPSGQNSDMYYHRKKGVISGNVGGIDFLENVDKNLEFFLKNSEIKILEWRIMGDTLGLAVNKKLILLAPIVEIVELQVNRVLKNGSTVLDGESKIKVPISFDDQKNPKEFMEIWRSSNSNRSIGFSNALGCVSASTLSFEVEY